MTLTIDLNKRMANLYAFLALQIKLLIGYDVLVAMIIMNEVNPLYSQHNARTGIIS